MHRDSKILLNNPLKCGHPLIRPLFNCRRCALILGGVLFFEISRVRVMVFNATFNNISVISWWSILLAQEIDLPREKHRPATSHWQTWNILVLELSLIYNAESYSEKKQIFTSCFDLIFGVLTPLSAISWRPVFSGGRSPSTRREPPTMDKQLVNFITCGCKSSAPFFVIYKAGREPTPYWW